MKYLDRKHNYPSILARPQGYVPVVTSFISGVAVDTDQASAFIQPNGNGTICFMNFLLIYAHAQHWISFHVRHLGAQVMLER